MGQLAIKVNEIDQRTTNSLPCNTIPNPREECKAITLISGQVASTEAQVNEEPVEKESPEEKKEEVEHILLKPGEEERCMQTELLDPNLQEPPDDRQQNLQLKPPLVTINKISPDIKPKFGVRNASSTKEEVPKKKKISRGWRNKKIPTKGFSTGMKVVLTSNLVWTYTVNRILSLEHIELLYGETGKKFKVRGE
ncbi:hypothetical protein AHAS_Ahas16G0162800 [Arachis hypogaea]